MSCCIQVSGIPSSSSTSSSLSSDSEDSFTMNGLKGSQSSSTSKMPTLWFTPSSSVMISSLNFLRHAELGGTRIFLSPPITAVKLVISQADAGIPTTFTHATLSKRRRVFLKHSTETNHLSQILLLALKTSAALPDLNFKATFMPPMYLTSQMSKPSNEIRDEPLKWCKPLKTIPMVARCGCDVPSANPTCCPFAGGNTCWE
ncbi:hypothetical protein LXL04_030255 [Taraxacum kok-saghyz]